MKMGFEVNIAGHSAGSPASYYGKENFGNKTDGKSPLEMCIRDRIDIEEGVQRMYRWYLGK